MADDSTVRGTFGPGAGRAASRAAARPQPTQMTNRAQVSQPQEPGSPTVLDAYDPLPYGILLIVPAALTHLLVHALGLDASLEVFGRLIGSVSRVIGLVG